MNLLLFETHEVDTRDPERGARLVLDREDRRAKHVRRVLRAEAGDELRVGRLGGAMGTARVESISEEREDGRVVLVLDPAFDLDAAPADPGDVDLVVGLPRPQALHRTLQFATAFGIRRLHLTNAWRVEKSYFQSPSLADAEIRRQLWLGAEQGRTTRVPEVRLEKLFVPFLRDLDDTVPTARLLAHPDADTMIEDALEPLLGRAERFVVAIGPEGGWIDREVETFGEEGFVPVTLGPWILKVEAAVTAALAQLELVRRRSGAARGTC